MTDIAVVIPCFNLARTIEEAVDSVLAQTRPAAEILVVDDGSTDLYTRQRLASLSRPRLRVVRIAHRGAAGARNHGVALTSSPYLLLLDADDALDATYLEKTGACLDREPELDFVSTAMQGFGEARYVWTPPPPTLTAAFTRGTIPITALLRRKVWDSVGGFDEALPTSMDLDFWITAFERGFRGRVLDEPLLLRRVRSDSLHHSAVTRGTYSAVLEAIQRKHRESIDRIGPELLIGKEAFILEQRSDRDRLEQRRDGLRAELRRLDDQIQQLQRRLRERGQPIVDFGDFRRLHPLSPVWGLERGQPVDRYYIERFLATHRSDIRGRVLEVKDPGYSERFGSADITSRDVLDISAENPRATIVADLTRADCIPSEAIDCFILTQTLHIIYDVRAALFHAYRVLKPGGVLLATLPAVSRINYEDGGLDRGDYWRFTEASLRRLFADLFPPDSFDVIPAGNLKACMAFLYGLATEDLRQAELDHLDRRFPLVFCVRALKPAPQVSDAARRHGPAAHVRARGAGTILMYHRITDARADPHRLCVSPAEFTAHMQYLRHRHPVLSLEDLVRAAAAGDLPEGAVAVTFDDGTLDALELASPALMGLGVPATFFVNTDRLDEEHEPWWNVLERIFLSDAAVPAALEIILRGDEQVFPMRDMHERAAAHAAIHRSLMCATLPEREQTMLSLVRWSGMALPARRTHRVLLRDEIRRLAERPGHTIGAHSVHHLLLPSQSREVQDQEIRESRRDLEHLLGRSVTLFSYPYGGRDRDTVELVRAAGFLGAVTVDPGTVSGAADVYALPRLAVRSAEVSAFAGTLQQLFSRAASDSS